MTEVTKTYNSEDWDKNSRILIESSLSKLHRKLLLSLSKFTGLVRKTDKILDLGCGSGAFLVYFSAAGYSELYGIEPDKELVKFIPESIAQVKIGIAEEIPFADNFFDVVYVYGVLHHLKTDEEIYRLACKEAARVVKPNGHIFIIEPGRYYVFLLFELVAKILGFFSKTFKALHQTMMEEKTEQHFFLKHHGVIRKYFADAHFNFVVDKYFLYSWLFTIQKKQ